MKKLLVTIFMFAFILELLGCSNTSDDALRQKPAVVFAIGNTANASPIDLNAPIIKDTMIDTVLNYGCSFIIRIDGQPELVSSQDFDIEERFKKASKAILENDAQVKADNVLTILGDVKAAYPEVDYLEALRQAGSSLNSVDSCYTSKKIVMCGTGLQTTGYLDFKNNLFMGDPETIVEMLVEKEALPDLTNITVYWIGMGKTLSPQQNLTPKQQKHLEKIWQKIVETSGGQFIKNDFISVNPNTTSSTDLPKVSVVDLPSDTPIYFDAESLESNNVFQEPIILDQSQIQFIADEAHYLSPQDAVNTMSPIADYLVKHEAVNILLIGSTAGDITTENELRLSQARAEAVRNTLAELGVDPQRIVAIGLGSDDPWHLSGVGYQGALASNNRKVVLLDASTDEAKRILSEN